jgi:hypothetical protein
LKANSINTLRGFVSHQLMEIQQIVEEEEKKSIENERSSLILSPPIENRTAFDEKDSHRPNYQDRDVVDDSVYDEMGLFQTIWTILYPLLPQFNFFWLHLLYFVVMSFLGCLILSQVQDISFIDSWFISTSAICVTGLSTLDISLFRVNSQVVILIWMQCGGLIFISIFILFARLVLDRKVRPQRRRIIRYLLIIVTSYLILCQLIGFLIMGIYLEYAQAGKKV